MRTKHVMKDGDQEYRKDRERIGTGITRKRPEIGEKEKDYEERKNDTISNCICPGVLFCSGRDTGDGKGRENDRTVGWNL